MCYRQVMKEFQLMPQLDLALRLDEPNVLPAGKLCLEFANTMNWHASISPSESLYTYNDLVDWAESAGLQTSESARKLKVLAELHPSLAEQVYDWAIDLREAMYRLFVALSR